MKALARHLLLAALLLRAMLPAGWMPNPHGPNSQGRGETALVICLADGTLASQHAPGKPAPDEPQHHEGCAFAAAPHLAKTPDVAILAAPSLRQTTIQFAALPRAVSRPARHQPQSPRAPPAVA